MQLGNKLKSFLLIGTFVVMVLAGCATDKSWNWKKQGHTVIW